MKKTTDKTIAILLSVFSFIGCNNNKVETSAPAPAPMSQDMQVEIEQELPIEQEKPTNTAIEIAGTYSGIDNVGMESTIMLLRGGSLIIRASVGDGTPDYGSWSGTADNLSLYHKDEFGNDELIANARVTQEGLKIIGGNFYPRQ